MPGAHVLTDAVGVEHRRASGDVRILCLVPSITELLCDLGLRRSVVGRTGFCIHPAQVIEKIPKVGGTKDVRLDQVRRLKPTHAIVNIDENRRETAAELREFVQNVIVTHPQRPQDNVGLFRLLGAVFGRETQADALVRRFDRTLKAVRRISRGLPERKVLYLIWRDPWMTVSSDTYISRTLGLFNLHTVPGDDRRRYPEINLDEIRRNTDLILLSSEPYPFRGKHLEEFRRMDLGGARSYLIDGEMVSWYGSRAIAGLEYMVEFSRQIASAST